MKKYLYLVFLVVMIPLTSCIEEIKNFSEVNRKPAISPDYTGILIPPNIAPLNFKILEPGEEFEVRIYCSSNNTIKIRSNSPIIRINLAKWHSLLEEGKGSKLFFEVFIKDKNNSWQKFETIENDIALENIDNHLAYRLINTGYVLWNELGIWQRNLENFNEKPILENKSFEYGCLNCHSFRNNDPDYMMLHTRALHGGTIIGREGKLTKINTKTPYTLSAGAYPNWHPDGKHIVFSVNTINQHFANGDIRIEVSDEVSDLVVYDIEKNILSISPKVSGAARENLPVWSPDGKYIYFISAPPATTLANRIYAKYELLRIGFDVNTNTWGDIDTVLSSAKTGMSISFPKISPNGKFLMFCMSDHGYFTIHHPMNDLYLMNLLTGEFHKMEINSPQTDSYHCFSKAGHWFVFSSKRMDGLFTRPFFSYLDDNGKASKPFVLPQENPEFYDHFIKNYNIPELITGEVKYSPVQLRDKVLENPAPAGIDPSVDTIYMKAHLSEKTY